MDLTPLWVSFRLAMVTTLCLFPMSLFLAFYLHRLQNKPKSFLLQSLLALPILLPPTVLGFYLLLVFSPNSWLGAGFEWLFGYSLLFSFTGLVIASMVYSLPFMVYPLYNGMRSLPQRQLDFLSIHPLPVWTALKKVYIPQMWPQIITALVLTFAHTMSEFGVLLMIGGNASSRTKVASIAIYEYVETLNYPKAHAMAFLLVIISLFTIISLHFVGSMPVREAFSRKGN